MERITNQLSVKNQERVRIAKKLYQVYSILGFYNMSSVYQLYYVYRLFIFFKKYNNRKKICDKEYDKIGIKDLEEVNSKNEYKRKSLNNIKMDATNEVISSLKFIGKLKKGDKINTKFMYTQPDGIWTRITRTFVNHDNRHNTLNFVQRTIYNAFGVISTYEKSSKVSDKNMCKNVIEDLKNAKVGLNNLRETYSEDLKFNCDISTLLQSIESKLEDVDTSGSFYGLKLTDLTSKLPVYEKEEYLEIDKEEEETNKC